VPHLPNNFLQSHWEAFHDFTLLAVFAPAHVALALICLALGTIGGSPWIAALIFVGGTMGMALLWDLRAQTRRDDPLPEHATVIEGEVSYGD